MLELGSHCLKVAAPATARRRAPLRLLGPVELPRLGLGVSAHGAAGLLDVVGHGPTAAAGGVRLVLALSEGGGTLSHVI